ncbi:MAG: FtsX-like permease family protein [Patescibacteria group bacterium]
MFSIALKNLFQDKGRAAISIGGVAFSVLLIFILQGLYWGWHEKINIYTNSVDTDLWVVQEGFKDTFHTASFLPKAYKDKLEKIADVKEVNSLLNFRVALTVKGKENYNILIGFDAKNGIGGPAKIIKGNKEPKKEEIIIDTVFAKKNNLELGDKIKVYDKDLKISGISSGGDVIMAQYSFLNLEQADDFSPQKDFVNFYLVKLEDQSKKDEVIKKIKDALPNVNVLDREKFGENNRKLILESFIPILWVLVIIGFIIGVAVIGLTIYTATIEKTREYGILKAIGATNLQLYFVVIIQALISAIFGYILGIVFSYLVSYLANYFEPIFVTNFREIDFVYVFAATILMSFFAAFIPIKKISAIDPAIVFKG